MFFLEEVTKQRNEAMDEVARLRDNLAQVELQISIGIESLGFKAPRASLHPADKIEKYLVRPALENLAALGYLPESPGDTSSGEEDEF